MKKIMYIAPHLSTGGMPQYLLQRVESLCKTESVTVIEYNNYSNEFTVQKDAIKQLVEVFTLEENKLDLLNIIDAIKPDLINFQENPETFVDDRILKEIYSNRSISKIVFAAHSSDETFENLKYKPSAIRTVSKWQSSIAEKTGIRVEFDPYFLSSKERKKDGLFKEDRKNILMVGLFTPGKNQGELFEIARALPECDFHFVGNQAGNFESYWKPLMENKPDNCIIWGERNDVDRFYANADLFYFSSLWELMPICMIEAMSYGLPILCYKLDTYTDEFDAMNVNYLNNLSFDQKRTLVSLKSGNEKYSISQMEDDVDAYEKYFDVEPDDVVMDIGSNIGLFAKKHSEIASKIYAIEPSRVFVEKINSYELPNVETHTVAIADKNGKVFIDFEENVEDPLFIVNYADGAKEGEGTETETVTFKSFIKRNKIEKIDFLKIDCEGSEYDILTKENMKWIKSNCKKVVGEFHIHNNIHKVRVIETLDLFEKLGIKYILSSVDGVVISRAKFNSLIDFYTEILFYFTCDESIEFKSYTTIQFDFNSGPTVEITDTNENSEFRIVFSDDEKGKVLHESTIKANHWTKCFVEYYVKWKIDIYKNGDLIHSELFDLAGKDVFIGIESKSLGDMLAWVPYVEEFRKKHNCNIQIATFNNSLFDYPELKFVDNASNTFATYRIGWFYNEETINRFKNPLDPKGQEMQKTASDILGLDYAPIKPIIKLPKVIKKETVTLGIHSTTQAKYWNNKEGWQSVVDYINSIDYKPVILSNEPNGYMGNYYPENAYKLEPGPLNLLIAELCASELFVGIGSGLSWLAWACNVPVIMISGFSEEYTEFPCMRIGAPKNTCSGCFNRHQLDQNDWNWCPDKSGEDKFECTKRIEPNLIRRKIKQSLIE